MPLSASLSGYWQTIQGQLFPWLEEELGPLSERHRQLVTVLETARLEAFVPRSPGRPGRPPAGRWSPSPATILGASRPDCSSARLAGGGCRRR